MTVQDLIEKLKGFDLEREIRFVGVIESGRGVSWVEVDDCDVEEREGEIVLGIEGDVDEDGGCE